MRLLLFVASFAFLSAEVFAQQTWSTRRNIPGGAFLWGIAHGSRGLVFAGTNGRILTSPDGDTWTARTSGTSAWLTSVAYGNNQYVIVGARSALDVVRDRTDVLAEVGFRPGEQERRFGLAAPRTAFEGFEELEHALPPTLATEEVGGAEVVWRRGLHW